MAKQLFAYIEHAGGSAGDTALELVTAAGKLGAADTVTAVVLGSGAELDKVCQEVASGYKKVWKVDNEALAYPNAELIRELLLRLLPSGSLLLIPNGSFGMDLGPGLSVKMGGAYVSDCVNLEGLEGDALKVVRQEYSGQVSTHVSCDVAAGAVVALRPGAFPPDETGGAGGQVEDKTAAALSGGVPAVRRRFVEVREAEAGDVDITKADILVSCGRGIEDEANLELAFELAKVVGGEVSCSRPIVDAKWLPKPRQVGTSGQTVKPKVYYALGISGTFQHLGGLKGNPFIVAINKNPKAPIFQVADVGVVGDILQYIPALTEKVKEMK